MDFGLQQYNEANINVNLKDKEQLMQTFVILYGRF